MQVSTSKKSKNRHSSREIITLNFLFMKTLLTLLALLATSSVSACGAIVTQQNFQYVPLSEFGVDSALNLITPPIASQTTTFDYSKCVQSSFVGSQVTQQNFPKVELAKFNVDSWKTAN
jgi:hypothetical protein